MKKLLSAGFVAVLTASLVIVAPANANTAEPECSPTVQGNEWVFDFCTDEDLGESTVVYAPDTVQYPCRVLKNYGSYGPYTSLVTTTGETYGLDCVEEPRDPSEYIHNHLPNQDVAYNNYKQPKAHGKARVNTDCKIVGAKLQKRNIVFNTKGPCIKPVAVGTRSRVGLNTFEASVNNTGIPPVPVIARTSISIVSGEPTKKHPNGDRAYVLKHGKKISVYRNADLAAAALLNFGPPERWLEPEEEAAGLVKFLTESTGDNFVNPVHDRYQG